MVGKTAVLVSADLTICSMDSKNLTEEELLVLKSIIIHAEDLIQDVDNQ